MKPDKTERNFVARIVRTSLKTLELLRYTKKNKKYSGKGVLQSSYTGNLECNKIALLKVPSAKQELKNQTGQPEIE